MRFEMEIPKVIIEYIDKITMIIGDTTDMSLCYSLLPNGFFNNISDITDTLISMSKTLNKGLGIGISLLGDQVDNLSRNVCNLEGFPEIRDNTDDKIAEFTKFTQDTFKVDNKIRDILGDIMTISKMRRDHLERM